MAVDETTKLMDKVEVTGAGVIKKLRSLAAPKGKKGCWLRFLSDKQLAEVYHRLRLGQSAHYVTKMCQDDWSIRPGAQTKSLARSMRTFQKQVIGLLPAAASEESSEEKRKEITKTLRKAKNEMAKVDALYELRDLVMKQKDRVAILIDREKKSLPFKFTDGSIKILGDLIGQLLKAEIDLGLREVRPDEFNLNLKASFDGMMEVSVKGEETAFHDTAKRFLEMVDNDVITMVRDADGGYTRKIEAGESESGNGGSSAGSSGESS